MKRWNWIFLGALVVLMVVAEYVPFSALKVEGKDLQSNLSATGFEQPNTAFIDFGGGHSFSYSPAELTISAGQTVVWRGNFSTHALVSDTWLWDAQWKGTEFSYTFTKPGTYHYYCQLHGAPQGIGMSGVVIVK